MKTPYASMSKACLLTCEDSLVQEYSYYLGEGDTPESVEARVWIRAQLKKIQEVKRSLGI